jgi:hypothetical protein
MCRVSPLSRKAVQALLFCSVFESLMLLGSLLEPLPQVPQALVYLTQKNPL